MSTTLDFRARVPTVLSFQSLASFKERFSTVRSLGLPLAIAGAGLLAYLICNIIYNVYFHPYAKYPGPFLAKFTDLYAGYHAWKGDIHLDMWRCHQVYGDKVRYAPNRLNINTVTGLKSTELLHKSIGAMLMLPQTSTKMVSHTSRARITPQWSTRLQIRSLSAIEKTMVAADVSFSRACRTLPYAPSSLTCTRSSIASVIA
jgi:hypothetical protein